VERSGTDYYRTLQVDPEANPLVVQAAYRVLAQIFHPDVSGDDAEMKRINAAWEVLRDPVRRRQYDIERAGRHPGQVERHPGQAQRSRGPARPQPATASPTATGAWPRAAASGAPPTEPARPTPPSRPPRPDDHAGPPVGEPFGPLLKFGRYEGWTVGQVARVDRPFLEWLRGAPAGRGLKDEIDAVFRSVGMPGVDRRRYDSDRQRVHAWAPGAPTKLR
jgi:curved DNA-binding protein CbpA